jgi:hypothetical protein
LTAIQQTLGRLSSNSGTQPSQAPSANAVSDPSEQHITPLSVVENSSDTSDKTFFYRDEHVGNLPEAPMSLGQTLIEASQAENFLDQFVTRYYSVHSQLLIAVQFPETLLPPLPYTSCEQDYS